MNHARVVSASELRQTGLLQQRSLSLPFSRIVLNPQNFQSDDNEFTQNCDPTLPLGLGYYAFDQAIIIPRFLSLWALTDVTPSTTAVVTAGAVVPPEAWMTEGARVTIDQAMLVVSLPTDSGTYSGSARARVRLDARTPVLRIAVRAVTGQWDLHLTSGGTDDPVLLLPGAATAGLHYLDLRTLAPGRTTGEFDLILGVIGSGAEVVIDELRFVPALRAETAGALEFEADWTPGGLGMTARYCGARAHGLDTFVDLDSLVREIEFDDPLPPDARLALVGRHIAAPSHDAESGTVTMSGPGMCAVVVASEGGTVRYYTDESELVAGGEGSPVPVSSVGVWAMPLVPGWTRYRIGCGVTPDDPARATVLALEAARASADERLEHWLRYWDGLLSKVPHPSRFELRGVEPCGVGPKAVREAYYRAFVGLHSNVLPPQPETGFKFPTVATGKGSMWNYAAPGARSAAAWETFLAIQFLAYGEADLAWCCFNGQMSRVDDEGSLAGESLPSRKAQTAWVLYSLTGDTASLATAYPALKRLLKWQAERPRWIYGTYDNPGEQDAEFLSSLIIDLGFGSQIATVLGHDEDAIQFDHLRDELGHDYQEHCFIGPQREAVQHWFPGDDDATMRGGPTGYGLQVAMGLAIPGISDWQTDSLLARFDAQFDPDDQLAGFDFAKHPNVGYTVTGLLDHNRPEQAQILLNAVLRDVIRAGSFAEVYDRGVDGPHPIGVRPSIFGMTQIIDAVWLNNGLRMDLGAPTTVTMPGVAGAVSGIPTTRRSGNGTV